jgi:hypothetical protein
LRTWIVAGVLVGVDAKIADWPVLWPSVVACSQSGPPLGDQLRSSSGCRILIVIPSSTQTIGRPDMATTGLVLITGATGRVGSALLDRLSDADVDLRVLSHDESKAQSVRNRGVEVIHGDFLTPETLVPALDQVTAVFLATPIHPEQITQATTSSRRRRIQASLRA